MARTLIGIGNTGIDITVGVPSDEKLLSLGFQKGSCVFFGPEEVKSLLTALPDPVNEPGGAAANVLCAFAALGGNGRFVGRTGYDDLKDIFINSLRSFNIAYDSPSCEPPILTSQIITAVTPDGERSFAVNHGSSHYTVPEDVNPDWFGDETALLLDGYMLMSDNGPRTLKYAVECAKPHGVPIIFMPNSLGVIENQPDEVAFFMSAATAIICNIDEALALTNTTDESAAFEHLKNNFGFEFGVVTHGPRGANYFGPEGDVYAPVPPMDRNIINTNGAGDGFAGGFLYGLFHGMNVENSLRLGHMTANVVLHENAPRPSKMITHLLEAA